MASLAEMTKSPTFFVGAERQKKNLEDFHRREQTLAEAYHKNKPLCFNARGYQKTHPAKAKKGHKDADATLGSPMILGVADGVSQIEDFGIDASLLPNELLKVCEELAMYQLIPGSSVSQQDAYRGPIPLLRRAFEATESLGSLTVVLAIMDNSTRIHGKLHPMVAIVTVGDCELLVLRRVQGKMSPLQAVCHTEMQRIDGHAQTPLQLARVDERIDPDFYEGITIEVIEKGSAVHCVSAYEGDIILMGSDGVFDNLFLDEITDICNSILPAGKQVPTHEPLLSHLAQCIVNACHQKTHPGPNGQLPEAPIGRGGKKDDTSCVVAEVVEWSEAHAKVWMPRRRHFQWQSFLGNFINFDSCCAATHDSEDEIDPRVSQPASPCSNVQSYHNSQDYENHNTNFPRPQACEDSNKLVTPPVAPAYQPQAHMHGSVGGPHSGPNSWVPQPAGPGYFPAGQQAYALPTQPLLPQPQGGGCMSPPFGGPGYSQPQQYPPQQHLQQQQWAHMPNAAQPWGQY